MSKAWRRVLMGTVAALAAWGAVEVRAEVARGTSEWSAAVRVDARRDFGGRLVHGVQVLGDAEGGAAEVWNTMELADGWKAVQRGTNWVEVAVVNGAGVAVEYGRMGADAVWGNDVVHVVRDWVAVPEGVTLAIGAGAVVKFTQGTGILVEKGGTLRLGGAREAPVVLTSAEDDSAGGDTDMREETVSEGEYAVVSEGTVEDSGWTETLHGDSSKSGAVALATLAVGNAVATWKDGVARVPVSVGGSRDMPFGAVWETVDGSAELGRDFLSGGGVLQWESVKEGTKFIEIPLETGVAATSNRTFGVRLTRGFGGTVAGEGTVTLYGHEEGEGIDWDRLSWGEAGWCRTARVDCREDFGGRVVHGTETMGAVDGGAAVEWDTTRLADGWQEVSRGVATAEVVVLNAPDVAVEHGRMESDAAWESDKVHVVRDWVAVPEGRTLAIGAGAVVKFTRGTGIAVEKGGTLRLGGTQAAPVVLTAAEDDSAGGDTDMREAAVAEGGYALAVEGTVEDSGWTETLHGDTSRMSAIGFVTLDVGNAVATWKDGVAKVPVTVSGTRGMAFGTVWEAVDGSAEQGRDYLVGRGVLQWNNSDEGTKFIAIPLGVAAATTSNRTFIMRLAKVYGGAARGTGEGKVTLYGNEGGAGNGESGHGESEWCAAVRVDGRASREGALLTEGDEWVTWDSTWDGASMVRVKVERPGGTVETLGEAGEGGKGSVAWMAGEVGRHVVRYGTWNGDGQMLRKQERVFVRPEGAVALHRGGVGADETWVAGTVHVVDGAVAVGNGVVLTIERGAVVKFTGGSALAVANGGTCVAEGAVFTHINDDTVGGDTMGDGAASGPVADDYRVSGNVVTDAATELRWLTMKTAGTLSSDTVWMGSRVICVTGNVTVASGATLTVLPGAIVKVNPGVSLTVNSGGTLNALGTRAQPIVFTSIKDDEFGGDTNGDGDATRAQPGDWTTIKIAGGTAHFSHASILYSSRNQTTGAINMTGGKVVFDSGEIAHGLYDAVGVESGNFHMTNSVIRDCLLAFRHWAKDPIVNCVIYDCGRLTQGGGQHFRNCIFANITEAWEAFGFPQNGTTYDNCCFWNEGGSVLTGEGTQDAMTVCGKNGNIWGNPLFLDADGGDFRVAEGSPCVDAGDTAVAPETDYYGQPRASVFGEALADIGIYEVQPRGVAGDVDLVPVSVSADAGASPGGELRVSWVVGNQGGKVASGARRDAVSLVSAGGREVSLGEKVFSQSVAAGGTVKCEAVFRVPPMAEGTWWPKVVVNSQQDIFEGSLIANNAKMGETGVEVGMEAIDPATARDGVIYGGSPTVLKLRFAAENEDRMVKFRVPAGVKVTWGFGFVPQGSSQSGEITSTDGLPVHFLVPEAEGEMDVYVLLASDTTESYELSTESTKLTVTGVTPGTLPSSGTMTLSIMGAGFGETNAVTLVGAGASIRLQTVEQDASGNLVATVDCSVLAGGMTYDVHVESDGRWVELPEALVVVETITHGKIEARLDLPKTIRQGRIVVGFIEYANVGDSDVVVPIFTLRGKRGDVSFVAEHADGLLVETLQLVGLGPSYPKGILRPGDTCRMPFKFKATGQSYNISLSLLDAASPMPRNSVLATWKDFSDAISAAATRMNGRTGVMNDFSRISENAMRSAYGQDVECIAGTLMNVVSDDPMPGQVLQLVDSEGALCAETTTGPDGTFRFDNLPADGKFRISSTTCQAEMPELVPGLLDSLSLALYGADFATVECNVDGNPRAVVLVDSLTGKIHLMESGKNGTWTVAGIPDGEYMVDALFDDFQCLAHVLPICVDLGLVTNGIPHVTPIQGGRVELALVDEEGKAVCNLQGDLFCADTGYLSHFISDKQGNVEATLPAGDYAMALADGYFLLGSENVEVVPGTVSAITGVVGRNPAVVFPSCGPCPLQTEFSLAETNGMDQIVSCYWDFDADGSWDGKGFCVTNTYTNAGNYAARCLVEFADGTQRSYNAIDDIEVWESTGYEPADGTCVLDGTSGYEIVSRDDGAMVLAMTGNAWPVYIQEGDVLIDPDDLAHPRKVLAIVAIDQFTLQIETEFVPLESAFYSARLVFGDSDARPIMRERGVSDALNLDYDDGGTVGLNGSLEWERGHGTVEVDLSAGYTHHWVIKIQKGTLRRFEHRSGFGGKIEVKGNLSKAGYLKNKSKEEVYRLSRSKGRPKKKTIVDKVFPVGVVPIRVVARFVGEIGMEGSFTANVNCGVTAGYDGEKWSKHFSKGFEIEDLEVGATVYAKAGIELEAGVGVGRDVKGKNYSLTAADLNVDAGGKVAFEVKLHDETQPDEYEFWAGPYLTGTLNILHAVVGKWADIALVRGDFGENTWKLYSRYWATPIPDFSVDTTQLSDDTAKGFFSSTTPTGGSILAERQWKCGGVDMGTGNTAEFVFACKPDDWVSYDVVLRERYMGLLFEINFDFTRTKIRRKTIRFKAKNDHQPELVVEDAGGSVPQSYDPNEIAGPLGTGATRLVAPGTWMTYTVYFENKSDATAAAQEVTVTEQLSGALDWSTFEMVDVGFNNQLDLGLGGKRRGASVTAMTGTAYKVRTELDFDAKKGTAKWYMRIVDESTETRWPRDVYAGFLPPNDATGRGEGHITYRVKLRDDAAAGTVVRASANIVFDYNAAIETDPAWWNTVAEMGTATVDLGNGVSTNVTVMVGAPWIGQLPDPGKRPGMRFAGWFTGPNGTGSEVTEESVAAAGAKLYAFWDATAAPELWMDVSWGAVEIGTNGVVKGYAPNGSSVEGIANRYVLTGTSSVHGVRFEGGSFTNTWTNLVIDLDAKDAVAVALEGARVEVTLEGDNFAASGEDCAGVRVDTNSVLALQGPGRLEAYGGKCGAGIGGGKLQESGRVEIRAGTVEAYGGEYGAGIGGGLVAPAAGAVIVTGGSVKARGSDGGEAIGGGFGREGTGAPTDGAGTAVCEVEVPFATDTLPVMVAVDLGGGRTYQYAGMGHEDDTSLWFWLPDGTYDFEADGDDYGAHVAGAKVAAVFTDPGAEHFESPAAEMVESTATGWRVGLNPAFRTTPFVLWTATRLDAPKHDWAWEKVSPETFDVDPATGLVEWTGAKEMGLRVFRFEFLPKK